MDCFRYTIVNILHKGDNKDDDDDNNNDNNNNSFLCLHDTHQQMIKTSHKGKKICFKCFFSISLLQQDCVCVCVTSLNYSRILPLTWVSSNYLVITLPIWRALVYIYKGIYSYVSISSCNSKFSVSHLQYHFKIWFNTWERHLFSLPRCPDQLWVHPANYQRYEELFFQDKEAEEWS